MLRSEYHNFVRRTAGFDSLCHARGSCPVLPASDYAFKQRGWKPADLILNRLGYFFCGTNGLPGFRLAPSDYKYRHPCLPVKHNCHSSGPARSFSVAPSEPVRLAALPSHFERVRRVDESHPTARLAQGRLRESRGLSGEAAEPLDGTCENAERLRRGCFCVASPA
jgi:hypothetical protein